MENKLDGNAVAGILQAFFPFDMTLVQAACTGCGTTNAIGATKLATRRGDRHAVRNAADQEQHARSADLDTSQHASRPNALDRQENYDGE